MTIFIPIASVLIAGLVSFIVTNKTIESNNETKLRDEIFQINRLAIEYPYFEENKFCSQYEEYKDEKTLRYDSYCCIVFNLLEKICEHFKYKKNKIEQFFGIQEMITRHSKWWLSEVNRKENMSGYSKKFIYFIDECINKSEEQNVS
jgi:hypothetical protein